MLTRDLFSLANFLVFLNCILNVLYVHDADLTANNTKNGRLSLSPVFHHSHFICRNRGGILLGTYRPAHVHSKIVIPTKAIVMLCASRKRRRWRRYFAVWRTSIQNHLRHCLIPIHARASLARRPAE